MPFLEDMNRRKECDTVVEAMVKIGVKADGDLNYILYKYFKYNVERRYNAMKMFVADIFESAEQIRADFIHPYEAEIKKKNGDV